MQQQVLLTPQVIEQIREQTGQKWRDCQRKDYCIYACIVPAGYVFANRLEQPLSYNAIIKANKNNPFMKVDDATRINGLVDFLKVNGCYTTDGSRIVLCGTQGEFWDVKSEKLVSSYTLQDGRGIDLNGIRIGTWFVVRRASESRPSSVAIQLPVKFLGIYQTSWATLRVNDTNSSGHGSGDILVAPKLLNGMPDYAHISPTNNAVFAFDKTKVAPNKQSMTETSYTYTKT